MVRGHLYICEMVVMSLSKVTIDLQYPVTDSCVFQDLFNGQVKEIGKECDRLYLLSSQSTRRSEELSLLKQGENPTRNKI